ncbi:MAG TPA: hypothetical protein PLO89_06885 [Spirochaetota bacterium]|nr:hypothetical protein [Spirochaetota bacterium]
MRILRFYPLFIFIFFSLTGAFSSERSSFISLKTGVNFENKIDDFYLSRNYAKDSLFLNALFDGLNRYEFKKKEENLFRRAEILFFGSLTIVTFSGWIAFSIYNMIIYGDTFGNLRRDQFLILYGGSAVISFSVAITDLFIQLKPKIKNVEIY